MESNIEIPGPRPKNWATPFFTIWSGQAFSLLGSQLAQFALVWWLTQSTGSATVLATATLFGLLPQVFLSPFAGALVDRWNRRLVMMAADSTIAVLSLGLAYLFFSGQVQIWHVYAVMLLRSAGGAFHWPAMQASTSLMVPKEQLARVGGLNQTLFGLMSIAAPPLGALLLSLIPIHGILMVDVGTALMAVVPLFFVGIPQPRRVLDLVDGKAAPTSLWSDLRAGFRYVASWPGMLIIMVMATLINFLVTPAFSLMPLLITKHFGGEAIQLGILNSTWGIGLLAGGLALSAWGGFKRRVATSLMGLTGMGVGIMLVGLSPAALFSMAVVGMGVGGFMNPMANGPLFAVLQSVVAPEMQGRVMSLLNAAATAMSPLSLAVAGPLSDLLGIRIWYLMAGLLCVVMGLGGFLVRPVMTLEEQKEGARQ